MSSSSRIYLSDWKLRTVNRNIAQSLKSGNNPFTMEADQGGADFCGHLSWSKPTHEVPTTDNEDLSLSTATLIEREPIESGSPLMQALWEQASCNQLAVPYKYQKVAALIVHWAKYLDEDLDCESESKELHDLFEKRFKFKSTILKLDSNRDPQRQLRRGLDTLVLDHDGPCRNNLLIVYYSGHGLAEPSKGLYITGKENYNPDKSAPGHGYSPHASWNEAEAILQDSSADVLTIIDSCSAGSIWKDAATKDRSWEVLAASNRWDPTAAPGPHSFTRALIDSLTARLDAHPDQLFSVFQLHDDIMKRRNDERSVFRTRHGLNQRYIKLAKLDVRSSHHDEEDLPAYTREAAFMTLRLSFGNRSHLPDEQLKNLARGISRAAAEAELGINKIDLVEFREIEGWCRLSSVVKLCSAVRKAQRLWRGRAARSELKRQRDEEVEEVVDDAGDGIGGVDDEAELSRLHVKRVRTDSKLLPREGMLTRVGIEPPSPSPSMGSD